VDFEQVAGQPKIQRKPARELLANVYPAAKGICGFCETKAYWLDDYALFMVLKDAHAGASWHTGVSEIAQCQLEDQYQQRLSAEIFTKYIQFEFSVRKSELERYANMRGIHHYISRSTSLTIALMRGRIRKSFDQEQAKRQLMAEYPRLTAPRVSLGQPSL